MQQFVDDDAAYFNWTKENPSGFVVNSFRIPTCNYLKLHRATCTFIQPPRKNVTTTDYIKTCSTDVAELVDWAAANNGGTLDRCSFCKPGCRVGDEPEYIRRAPSTRVERSAIVSANPTGNRSPDQRQSNVRQLFEASVNQLKTELSHCRDCLLDDSIEATTRKWLDGRDAPLNWATPGITPDEWFFISTLYGEMTPAGQRTHIRKYFPIFLELCGRDIRNLTREIAQGWALRSDWMRSRLCRMADVLDDRHITMSEYVEHLRALERAASPANPMPALDAIVEDHRATGWKTLSVFIRDCVKGNCFPIDSRVQNLLDKFGLPNDERMLVGLALQMGENPRDIARLFYEAGGEPSQF